MKLGCLWRVRGARVLPPIEAMNATVDRIVHQYEGEQEIPLRGYSALIGAFAALFLPMLLWSSRRGGLPRRWGASDVVLLGIATHKLTRILTRDWVTAPLRAPFTKFKKSAGGGEVDESARGHGMQRAIGELATCQYCTGPWVASALASLLVARPRIGRTVAGVLAMVTVSDWLHHVYAKLSKG